MASIAGLLDQALRSAGVPIVGVSIVDATNRATWQALFLPDATDPQKAQAQTIINTLDIDAAALADADATTDIDDRKLRAIAQALWEDIPAPVRTLAQTRTRAIAIWKTL